MSFPAKFGGICAKCAGRIPAGADVNFDGKAIRHAPRCPPKGSVTEVPAPAPRQYDDKVTDATKIVGRAAYKGKSGYLILWMGTTARGEAVKLAFRDGSKIFWADRAAITVEKEYTGRENYRTGRYEPMTFGTLNRLAKEFRDTPKEDRGQCESCGRWNGKHASDCDEQFGGMSGYNEHGAFILGADD